MSNEAQTSANTTRIIVGIFVLLVGCYERSLLGINNGVHDKFYLGASWFFWLVGPLLLVWGIVGWAREQSE